MPATLNEQAVPGKKTCTWQYTPTGCAQTGTFQVQVGSGSSAIQEWEAARQTGISALGPDLVVISIDGLGDENNTWNAEFDTQKVVYVRLGSQTLSMH
jgi:hypothetical protein